MYRAWLKLAGKQQRFLTMSMQDPLADMLTRIRNGQQAGKFDVTMPASNLKVAVADVLKAEGYVGSFSVSEGPKAELTIELRYFEGRPVIEKIQRASRPGLRSYTGTNDLPTVNAGLGVACHYVERRYD
jgi:small subunit ribosomal protein S8